MKSRVLRISLPAKLHRYLREQVRIGQYHSQNEVVRDAIRQMQQRELDQFERWFGDYPGAPPNEPTEQDDEAINSAIKRHRSPKHPQQAL